MHFTLFVCPGLEVICGRTVWIFSCNDIYPQSALAFVACSVTHFGDQEVKKKHVKKINAVSSIWTSSML
jgi:hypothetical protein